MRIKQNLLKGFAGVNLLAATAGNPITAQAQNNANRAKDTAGMVAYSGMFSQPDPNFPEQAGAKAFGDIVVVWSIDVEHRHKSPSNLIVNTKDGQSYNGSYLGFRNEGGVMTSYIQVDALGRFKILNGTSIPVARSAMPNLALLVNNPHYTGAGTGTKVAGAGSPPDKKPDGGTGTKAKSGGSDNPAAATDLKEDAMVPDATIVTPKTAGGVYTITYIDPTAKSKVSVDAKRVLTTAEWKSYSQLSPAQRADIVGRVDVELTQRAGHTLGNFVKLMPNTGKPPKGPLTIYTFPDDGGALIVHAAKEDPTGIVVPPEVAVSSH